MRIQNLLAEKMRRDVDRETSKKQSSENEIWFVIIRKKGQKKVHQMCGFLINQERQGDQSLKMLLIIQSIKHYETLPENFIRIAGWRGADEIQDLRSNFLRKDCDHMVKLGLADRNCESSCANHTSAASGQNSGSFMETLTSRNGEAGAD